MQLVLTPNDQMYLQSLLYLPYSYVADEILSMFGIYKTECLIHFHSIKP